MKIVILDGQTVNPGDLTWSGLEAYGELTVYDRTAPEQVIERIGDAEAVFAGKTVLTGMHLESCKNLRFVGVLGTGYNAVDIDVAKRRGIAVTNIPTYGTMAVAQFTIALLLELCHRIGAHSDDVRAGNWVGSTDFCYWLYPQVELSGKTLGIVGYGRIGQAVGRIAQALDMNVIAYDEYRDESLVHDKFRYVGMDELYAQSDVVSLHCPLFENNRGMINAASIAKMKTGVFIINASRGPLVIEQDLAEALNNGKVAGAAVDVLNQEPPKAGNPLFIASNCIITPHIAWAPKEARMRIVDISTENLAQFIAGKPQNVVNL